MSVAFTLMATDDFALEGVGGKVPPDVKKRLDEFGTKLRGLKATDQKGVSAAIACIVEMAGFAGWFDNPEKFAVELLKARTAAIEKAQKPKAV
jgi:hypothetical protein